MPLESDRRPDPDDAEPHRSSTFADNQAARSEPHVTPRDETRRPGSPPEPEFARVRRGRRPGEAYVRIIRPHAGRLRHAEPGHFVATARTTEPGTGIGGAIGRLRRLLIGAPLTSAQLPHERLSKRQALAVFASDALSSSAYAIDEILLVLVTAGSAALAMTTPIALAIVALLAIVAFSYRQTIRAYPQGGGSYIVTKDNLGDVPALVAAGSLLVGYLLTVAVSISAGVAAITSAVPALYPERVLLAVTFIVFMTIVNLRGVRESATILGAPTYLFIGAMLLMIGLGVGRTLGGGLSAPAFETSPMPATQALTVFLVLRAFAAGCAALTGTEAIADGVPAFKEPAWRNAQTTLTWMAGILAVLFFGVSFLASQLHVVPRSEETVVSQIARAIFGTSPLYYFVQIVTMAILILAANTSFADFPRLSYFLARDRYMPHQFQFRGERLAFSTGIVVLGTLAVLLVVVFNADTHALIPLYAVGVFIAFTVSQAAMVRRWRVRREAGWQRGMIINGIGAVTTGVVALIIATTRFTQGAWMVLILIPALILLMRGIHHHYEQVASELALERPDEDRLELGPPHVIVPVAGLNRGVLKALAYARSISQDVTAVYVTDDMVDAENLREKWVRWAGNVPLVIIESPYRSLIEPLLAYIDAMDARKAGPITVVVPEFVPRHWWDFFLHNQSALRLKAALFFRRNTIVTDVPYHLRG